MKRGTPDHPKMYQLARKLSVPRPYAVGIMEVLWHWVARFAPAGDIGKWDDAEIAVACDWRDDPTTFVYAMVEAGWLDRSDECRLVVHDWPEHCEDSIHTSLARSGKLFADGTLPSTSRLNAHEKAKAEQALTGEVSRMRANARKSAQTREKAPCLSQASAKPEPEPSQHTHAAGAAERAADPPPMEPEVLPSQPENWQQFQEAIDAAGMAYSRPELLAMQQRWRKMPLAEQLAAVRHIRDSLEEGAYSDPQYVPAAKNYLWSKGWERGVRRRAGPKADSKNVRAFEIFMAQRDREAG